MKEIRIYDSVKHEKVTFEPIVAGEVRFYVCGPTVYDDAHLGHARSSIVFDLWRRLLIHSGYKVTFVKNFTDIDDKIIKKAIISKQDINTLTDTYIKSYLKDMDALKILRADIEPKATDNIKAMEDMIQILLDKNIAYKTNSGDIYLSVGDDEKYGSISHRGIDDENISRIKISDEKKDERDFALWKRYKGGEDIGYDSILGFGRPGWHIECSAMINKHLAYDSSKTHAIDIHAGGSDLLFPHHENEASQTRCATDKEIAKYWIHNGFVNINGQKMSKSLGNSFFIRDALNLYDGEILRNYLLGVHYRSIINFNEEDLQASKRRLDKIYRVKKRVIGCKDAHLNATDTSFKDALLDALSEDLNISKALSIVEEMINDANTHLDANPKDKNYQAQICKNLKDISDILGLGDIDEDAYFQLGVDATQKEKINHLIEKRLVAKSNKDYALADQIRDELKAQGIEIKDSANGTIWEKL